MKKKFIAVAACAMIACFGAFALTGCGGSSSASSSTASADDFADLDAVTIISADSTSPDSAGNQWQEAFATACSDITGGKLTVDYHGNGELGGDADLLVQEQNNDIQVFVTQPATMVSAVPGLACFDLPMAFANYSADQIDSVLNGDNDFTTGLQEDCEAAGVHMLGWLQSATYRQVTSNKELKSLDDYQGFQIRTMENSNHMAFWSAVGAEPTPLAWAEVYFALQNGTVDGQENATDTCTGASLQEVQKYLCITNHILYANCMTINKDFWDSLDPAYQTAIEQAFDQATSEIAPTLATVDSDNRKVMEDAGMEVIEYDDSFFTDFVNNEGVQKVYTDISEQTDGLSDKLLEALKAA